MSRGEKPSPINTEIGRQVLARRTELGLTQAGLARQLGVTQQSVQKYEQGRARISAEMLVQLMKALKIEPRALFRSLDHIDIEAVGFAENDAADYDTSLPRGRDAMTVLRAFNAIEDKLVRKRLLDLIAVLSAEKPKRPRR